jgi:hypothetical protein
MAGAQALDVTIVRSRPRFLCSIKSSAWEIRSESLMLEPEFLATLEADVHLVADLMALRSAMPEKTMETARMVSAKWSTNFSRDSHTTLAKPFAVPSTARNALAAHATPTSTGIVRFAPTFATTSPNTNPSSRKP